MLGFDESKLIVFFGVPGSGKSTFCSAIIEHFYKDLGEDHVFCNYPFEHSTLLNLKYLSQYRLNPDGKPCLLLIDEASARYSNRDFKSFGKELTEFFCMHRHEHIMVIVFSQTYNGMDKKIRDVCNELYIVRKLGPVIRAVPVRVKIGINEFTKELCDEYYTDNFFKMIFKSMYIYAPRYWKHFDSYDVREKPSIWDVMPGFEIEPK